MKEPFKPNGAKAPNQKGKIMNNQEINFQVFNLINECKQANNIWCPNYVRLAQMVGVELRAVLNSINELVKLGSLREISAGFYRVEM